MTNLKPIVAITMMEHVENRRTTYYPPFRYFVTGLGVGYCKCAPGTAGSILGFLLFLPFQNAKLYYVLPILALLFGAGVYTTHFSFALFGQKDSGKIVIDEIVAILLTLFLLPSAAPGIATYALWGFGFFLFRLFDITKPIGVREAEHLPGGWGIMADDIVAAVYALIIIWPIYYLWGGL